MRCLIVFVLLFIAIDFTLPQTDATSVQDTLLTEEHLETLGEQTGEDSPIFDFLFNEILTSKIQVRSRFGRHLEPSIGFREGAYRGSSLKLYERVKFQHGDHFSGGFLTEKDAGEKKIVDFMTGNIVLSKVGPFEKCIIGDYYIEEGQGMVLWRSYDIAKGADVVLPARRNGNGLRPYLSSGENEFLRGAAFESNYKDISTTLFYSRRFRSASIDSLGNITSLYTLGYFRTESEASKKNNVSETIFGLHCNYYLSDQNTFGLTWYKSIFSNPLLLHDGAYSHGDVFQFFALDYSLSLSALSLFGEWAKSNNRIAGTSGILINPKNTIRIIMSIRNYPDQFVNLHGLAFGERSENERGFYLGVEMKPVQFLALTSYCDLFSFPQSNNQLFPSNGNDILAQIKLKPINKIDIVCRYHKKSTTQSYIIYDEFGFTRRVEGMKSKQNYRMNIDYRISSQVIVRGRYEMTFLKREYGENEKGSITYQDLVYSPIKQLWLNLRIAFFKTDSYDSGIYEYERDLEGVLSQPILYGRGVRWYLIVKYELLEGCELSAKYSDHIRDDVKRIGTGLDQLLTNHDDRISFQMDLKM
ncbi:MAG: hypothetical protein HY800_04420 [Ignavibacteriales bacterium]|nr:hypothetical protein [Ignavibacteriales bacterium]